MVGRVVVAGGAARAEGRGDGVRVQERQSARLERAALAGLGAARTGGGGDDGARVREPEKIKRPWLKKIAPIRNLGQGRCTTTDAQKHTAARLHGQ